MEPWGMLGVTNTSQLSDVFQATRPALDVLVLDCPCLETGLVSAD